MGERLPTAPSRRRARRGPPTTFGGPFTGRDSRRPARGRAGRSTYGAGLTPKGCSGLEGRTQRITMQRMVTGRISG